MHIINTILLAVGLSMDAFTVSVTNGMVMKKFHLKRAIHIALSFAIFQALMPLIGYWIGMWFSDYLENISNILSFFLLAFIGVKMIWEAVHTKADKGTTPKAETLTLKELLALSIATSLDALAVGVSFSLTGTDPGLPCLIIGGITFFVCVSGVALGNRVGKMFSKHAEIAGGVILILIAFKILFEGILS